MIFKSNLNGRSLIEEVRFAEQQLQLRQVSLHQEVRTLNAAIRKRVTAPDVMLWSVGAGYIVGELTKTRRPEHRAEHAAAESTPSPDAVEQRPSTVQLAMRYWAIARPIIATATSLLAPYIQAKAAHAGASVAVHEAMHEAGETQATHQYPA